MRALGRRFDEGAYPPECDFADLDHWARESFRHALICFSFVGGTLCVQSRNGVMPTDMPVIPLFHSGGGTACGHFQLLAYPVGDGTHPVLPLVTNGTQFARAIARPIPEIVSAPRRHDEYYFSADFEPRRRTRWMSRHDWWHWMFERAPYPDRWVADQGGRPGEMPEWDAGIMACWASDHRTQVFWQRHGVRVRIDPDLTVPCHGFARLGRAIYVYSRGDGEETEYCLGFDEHHRGVHLGEPHRTVCVPNDLEAKVGTLQPVAVAPPEPDDWYTAMNPEQFDVPFNARGARRPRFVHVRQLLTLFPRTLRRDVHIATALARFRPWPTFDNDATCSWATLAGLRRTKRTRLRHTLRWLLSRMEGAPASARQHMALFDLMMVAIGTGRYVQPFPGSEDGVAAVATRIIPLDDGTYVYEV